MSGTVLRAAVVGAFVQVACASAPATKPTPVATVSGKELALQVARAGVSEQAYRSMLSSFARVLAESAEKRAAADGKKLPAGFGAMVAQIAAEEVRYDLVVEIGADFLLRNFTDDEMRELLDIRQKAVVQKEVRLIPIYLQEAGQRMQQVLAARQAAIESKMKAMLAAQAQKQP
jgi:hypothetical protein